MWHTTCNLLWPGKSILVFSCPELSIPGYWFHLSGAQYELWWLLTIHKYESCDQAVMKWISLSLKGIKGHTNFQSCNHDSHEIWIRHIVRTSSPTYSFSCQPLKSHLHFQRKLDQIQYLILLPTSHHIYHLLFTQSLWKKLFYSKFLQQSLLLNHTMGTMILCKADIVFKNTTYLSCYHHVYYLTDTISCISFSATSLRGTGTSNILQMHKAQQHKEKLALILAVLAAD